MVASIKLPCRMTPEDLGGVLARALQTARHQVARLGQRDGESPRWVGQFRDPCSIALCQVAEVACSAAAMLLRCCGSQLADQVPGAG